MTSTGMYPPTDEHLTGFGAIVQQFARFERLMEVTMAALLGANLGPVTILVAGLGYAGKRDALLSLTKAKIMPAKDQKKIIGFLDDLHKYAGLRNSIAHSVWKHGRRAGAIKPINLTVRGGTMRVRGLRQNEPDYTADELFEISGRLADLHNQFRDYLESASLFPAIAENTERSSSPTSSSPGKPSDK